MSATSDRDAAIARLEQDFGALFARIRLNWREAAATVHPDLQPLGYRVLAALADGTVTSAGEIIDRFQTDKSAVSRQLRQLEELGLVEVDPTPSTAVPASWPSPTSRVSASRRPAAIARPVSARDWTPGAPTTSNSSPHCCVTSPAERAPG
jgi:hypothetical protein